MNNMELLNGISNLLDEKLKPIGQDVRNLKEDVKNLKEDVKNLKEDMQIVKDKVQVLESKIQILEDNSEIMKSKIQILEDNSEIMKGKIHLISLRQENDILPRLQNIEACYTSTYDRYRKGASQIETMQTDIDIMKAVIREHSEKLQKLA